MQARVELVRSLRGNRPFKEVSAALDTLDLDLKKKFHGPQKFFYFVSATTIPNFRPAILRTSCVETERRLAMTAIAIARFSQKNERPPAALDALVPEFLGTLPRDCMSGQPLCYRRNPDGTFVLYSVGEDGKDDGGDSSFAHSDPKLGLWQGRDAVWPSPAREGHAAVTITGN
jgi:hypothetical protein